MRPKNRSSLHFVSLLAAMAALIPLLEACSDRSPTEPVLPSGATVSTGSTSGSPALPPITDDAAPGTYERVTPTGYYAERYVVDGDGRFRLEYESVDYGAFEYGGTYHRDGSHYVFDFDGDSRWQALAGFRGDCLVVRYNDVMILSDFEDAEFCRSAGS